MYQHSGRSVRAPLALGFCLLAASAAAHPYLIGPAMTPGKRFQGQLQLTHNCFGHPTVAVVLRMPAESSGIETPPVKGWQATIDVAKNEISWQGGPEEGRVTLPFAFVVPAHTTANTLYFPIVQRCTQGDVHRWVEIPEKGQTRDDLSFPAAEAVLGQTLHLPEGEMDETQMKQMDQASTAPSIDQATIPARR